MRRPYAAILILALAACAPREDAPAADAGTATPVEPAPPVSRLDPAAMTGAWRIVRLNGAAPQSLGEDGGGRRVPHLAFSAGGYGGTSGCNFFGGLGLLESGRYHTAPGPQTAMGCGSLTAQEVAITGLMARAPRVALGADGGLTLTGDGEAMMLTRAPDLAIGGGAGDQPNVQFLLAGTRWTIRAIDGQWLETPASTASRTIGFEADSWIGRAGCASYSGGWRQEGDRVVAVGGMIAAAPAVPCALPGAAADASLGALMAGRPRFVVGPNGEILIAGGGHWLVGGRLRDEDLDEARLLAGRWQIAGIDGAAPAAGTQPALAFGPAGYSGTTGCNTIQGLFLAHGRRLFTEPGPQTEQGCGGLTPQEERITGLLAGSPRIALAGEGAMALVDRSGSLRLRRGGDAAPVHGTRATAFAGSALRASLVKLNGVPLRERSSDPESWLRLSGDRWELRIECNTLGGVWRRRGAAIHFFTDGRPEPVGCRPGPLDRRAVDLMRLMNGPARIIVGANGELLLAGEDHWLSGQVDRPSTRRR